MAYFQEFTKLLIEKNPTINTEAACLSLLNDGLPKPEPGSGDPLYADGAPVPMNFCCILRMLPAPSNTTQEMGTFLHLAAKYGYTELCLRMIKLKFDINHRRGTDGYTPLMVAAYYGHHELVKALLSKHADSSLRSTHDGTALEIAENTASINEAAGKNIRSQAHIETGRQIIVEMLTPKPKPPLRQRLWNGFVSFLAGLTLVYPLLKTIQYFWRKFHPITQPANLYVGSENDILATPSWCENYTAGLTFLGYRDGAQATNDSDSAESSSCFTRKKRSIMTDRW